MKMQTKTKRNEHVPGPERTRQCFDLIANRNYIACGDVLEL